MLLVTSCSKWLLPQVLQFVAEWGPARLRWSTSPANSTQLRPASLPCHGPCPCPDSGFWTRHLSSTSPARLWTPPQSACRSDRTCCVSRWSLGPVSTHLHGKGDRQQHLGSPPGALGREGRRRTLPRHPCPTRVHRDVNVGAHPPASATFTP